MGDPDDDRQSRGGRGKVQRRRGIRDPATTAYRFELDRAAMNFCDVRVLAERSEVMDFTVLYLTSIDEVLLPVMRYDTAHGDPHRDTLDWDGHDVEKHWIPALPRGIALDAAIREVNSNWEAMLADFLRRRPIR
jgi:hypothetical protein